MFTQKYIKECISYNKATGEVVRLKRPAHHFSSLHAYKVSCGKITNEPIQSMQTNKNGKSYLKFKLNGKSYLLHRVIWFFVTGAWPEFIDHKNGNGLCNKWKNLRSVDMATNNKNVRMPHTNTSGCVGVYFDKRYNNWYSCIWNNSRQIRIGTFQTFNEAKLARKKAESAYGYDVNHGSIRAL